MNQPDLDKFFDKNELVLRKLIMASLDSKEHLAEGSFFKEVADIQLDFEIDILLKDTPLEAVAFRDKTRLREADQKVSDFVNSLEEARKSSFLKRIEKLRVKSSLGEEWTDSLKRLIVTRIASAPSVSIVVDADEKKNSIHFIVGPNTSKKDLDITWTMSEEIRKKMFGTTKVPFATEKAVRDFMETSEMIEIENSKKDTAKNQKIKQIEIVGMLSPTNEEEEIPTRKEDQKTLNRLKTRKNRLKRVTN